MRGLMAALAVASLLLGSAAAMAQATRTPKANPFNGQETAPAAPDAPSPQSAPRAASPQPGATPAGGASQFQSEGAAKQACGADAVVWANTSGSKAWHVSGDKYYGHTKRGAYMCEQAAQQAGYHPSGGGRPRAARRQPDAMTAASMVHRGRGRRPHHLPRSRKEKNDGRFARAPG